MQACPSYRWALAIAVVAVVVAMMVARRGTQARLTLARDALGNEALVLSGTLAGVRGGSLFMIDTAYAGPPVISTSYLAASGCDRDPFASVEERFRRCVRALRTEVTEDARHAAVEALLRETPCRAFTSGCTMRLMGIGETSEAQADMLLCPALRFGSMHKDALNADVLVTNPLRGSVHILTIDYLLHRAPAILRPRAGRLQLRAPAHDAVGFSFLSVRLVGGAFAVPMEVGGTTLHVVVDTGAAAALSLGRSAVERVARCSRPTPRRRATQSGVHGERVCSDVVHARVRVGGLDLGDVEVFANASEVEGADGYAGMGLLRALDLWLEPGRLGVRRSGLPPRGSDVTAAGDCGRGDLACAS